MSGLVHLYYGEGKGKTTAAMGLAARALGQGLHVTIVQFLKSGTSGELEPLRQAGATIYSGKVGTHFVSKMTAEERIETRKLHDAHLQQALAEECDLLILDEACFCYECGLVDAQLLRKAVCDRPEHREVVLTGRRPAEWMIEAADYMTEMVCRRHPFEQEIAARKGIEY